jgi:hypothetical protein
MQNVGPSLQIFFLGGLFRLRLQVLSDGLSATSALRGLPNVSLRGLCGTKPIASGLYAFAGARNPRKFQCAQDAKSRNFL